MKWETCVLVTEHAVQAPHVVVMSALCLNGGLCHAVVKRHPRWNHSRLRRRQTGGILRKGHENSNMTDAQRHATPPPRWADLVPVGVSQAHYYWRSDYSSLNCWQEMPCSGCSRRITISRSVLLASYYYYTVLLCSWFKVWGGFVERYY